jgi:hypothetical protein
VGAAAAARLTRNIRHRIIDRIFAGMPPAREICKRKRNPPALRAGRVVDWYGLAEQCIFANIVELFFEFLDFMTVKVESCGVGVVCRYPFKGIGHFLYGAHDSNFLDRQVEVSEFCFWRNSFPG